MPFKGNWYSVGPGRGGDTVTVIHRLGTATLDIVSAAGTTLARHHREPDHAGKVTRHDEHVAALEHAVLAAFSDRGPCRGKQRRPAGPQARAEAAALRGSAAPTPAGDAAGVGGQVVVDFARYVAAAQDRARPVTGSISTDQGGGRA